MTKKQKNFIDKIKKNNKKVVAQYLALYTECIGLKKSMVTLTAPDGKLSTLLDIRRFFFKKLNAYKRQKSNIDLGIKYFSNIEYTKLSSPHLHIQLFYTNKAAIEKAFNKTISSLGLNLHINHKDYAKDNTKSFNYVIKDYMEFDLQRELFKHKFRGVNFITSSQKRVSNGVIKYLFKELKFKTKNRYKEILEMIDKKLIVISKNNVVSFKKVRREYKISNRNKDTKIKFVSISKIGVNVVYIFEKRVRRKKIHRFKKNDKRGEMWAL